MKWILFLVCIILGIIWMFPYMIFRMIFSRPKRSKKVPKFYQGTPHYISSRKGMAFMEKIGYEDAYMTSYDGLKLHAYIYKTEKPSKKFVLGIHGYQSYARPEYGPYIEFYRSQGYNMVLPDDRAHAPSEGRYIGFGVLDRLDCKDWTQYIVDTYGEDVEIILHGVSMGAATVLSASGEKLVPQVKGIVADCGYSSAWEVLSYQLKQMHLPVNYLLPKVEKICKKKAGFDFHHMTPLEQVQHACVPILFVQGGKDTMVPSFMVHDLYNACTSEKKLLYVEEATHAESICLAKEEYEKDITTFIMR